MARIAGVDLPRNKHANIALTYIYGIGHPARRSILDAGQGRPDEEGSGSERRRGQPHPPGHRSGRHRWKAICARKFR